MPADGDPDDSVLARLWRVAAQAIEHADQALSDLDPAGVAGAQPLGSARERAALAKRRELAAHRQAIALHEQAAEFQERRATPTGRPWLARMRSTRGSCTNGPVRSSRNTTGSLRAGE